MGKSHEFHSAWTTAEVDFLRENVDDYTNGQLAEILKRPLDSVKMKIRYEKIVRKNFKAPAIDQANEIWKNLKLYPNYAVSNMGRVKNITSNTVLRESKNTSGYSQVVLYNDEGHKTKRIHTLVALKFIGKRPFKYEINHIDGVKSNNTVENLEYVTKSDNIKHAIGLELIDIDNNLRSRGISHKQILTEDKVILICEMISKKMTNQTIALKLNITPNHVSQIRNKKTWKDVISKFDHSKRSTTIEKTL